VPYTRTIVVSPTPGNPLASGAALQAALDSITGNSSSDRWLIHLEPGIFDLGAGASLAMKPYVDIEGSGEGVTTIIRDGGFTRGEATVVGADNAEIRLLTIESRGVGSWAIALLLDHTDTRASHVTAFAHDGSLTYAIFAETSTGSVEYSHVRASSTVGATGIIADAGSSVTVRSSRVVVEGQGDTIAIYSGQSTTRILDTTAEAYGTGTVMALYAAGQGDVPNSQTTFAANSEFIAGPAAESFGVEPAGGGAAELINVRAVGATAGMRCRSTGGQSGLTTVRAVGSVFEGPTGILTLGDRYETRVSGGQIRGPVAGAAYKCAFVSDANFDPLTAACMP
jgi:hypothetical protein